MGKIITITIIFIAGILIFNSLGNKELPLSIPVSEKLNQTITPRQTIDVEINDKNYRIVWLTVENDATIQFFQNLDDRLTAKEALEAKSCDSLINGGFYTKENTPLGYFLVNGQIVSKRTSSSLFNGFVSFSLGNLKIGKEPEINAEFSFQSGPVILLDEKSIIPTVATENLARRVVLLKTKDGETVFMAIYDKDSVFLGPKLSELPSVIGEFSQKTGTKINDAINLDGGSASAFITGEVELPEITYIGSYFCLNEK